MNCEQFVNEAERLFSLNPSVTLPDDNKLHLLYELTEIMLKVNESMNLTTITDHSQIILKHYLDSLTVSAYIPHGASVIDVGCGAGFPSLPLALCREDIRITALDSTAKRTAYVQETAELLGIKNLTTITDRAESLAKKPEHREKYSIAVARAVADLPVLCELCLPFVKTGGAFISMKASKGDEEFERAGNAIKLCGGANPKIVSADITSNGTDYEKRRIIITEKVEKTPKIYPRNFAQISKKPL